MPVYRKARVITDFDLFDSDIVVDSLKVRFLPSFELTLNGDCEIPIDGDLEVLD